MMKKYSICATILILISGCSKRPYHAPDHTMPEQFEEQKNASTTEPLTTWWHQFNDPELDRLIQQALQHNYTLQQAIERIEQARAFYNIKKAQLFPQVNAAGTVSRSGLSKKVQQYAAYDKKTFSFYQLGFDAFSEMDIWGKLWHEKNARACLFQAQVEAMRDISIMLLADVARTYIELCALHQKNILFNAKLAADTALLKLLHDRYTAGLANNIDIMTQKQAVASSHDQLMSINTTVQQTKNQLSVLLGVNPENLSLSLPAGVPHSTHEPAVGMPSDLIRRRPDIRQAERQLAASHERVQQAIADYFPSFSLLGSVYTEASDGSNWFKSGSISWSIGPSIRWPLITFGRVRSQVNVQKSKKRQAALYYHNVILQALKDVENFLIAYFNNKEQLTFLQNKLNSATHEKTLITNTYSSGLSDNLQALYAEKNRIIAALEVIDVKQAVSLNLISLYKALGGGW